MNQKVLIFALALTAIVLVGVAFTEIGSLKKHRQTNSVLTYDQQMVKQCNGLTNPTFAYEENISTLDFDKLDTGHQMCQLFYQERNTKKKTVIKQFDEKCSKGLKLTAGERQLCNLYDQLVNATTAIEKPQTIADYDKTLNETCGFNLRPRPDNFFNTEDNLGIKTNTVKQELKDLCGTIQKQRELRATTTNYKLVQNGGLFKQNPVVSTNTKVISNDNLNAKQNPAAKSVNTNTNNYQQLPMWYMMGGDQEEILKWQMYNNMLNSNGGRL